jgi:peptidoglycan lytic transglycosylase G
MSDLVFTGANEVPSFPGPSEPAGYGAGPPPGTWDDSAEVDDYDDDTYYDDYDDLDDDEVDSDLPKRRGCRNALIVLAVLVVVGMVASWFAWSWVQGRIDPSGGPGEEVLVEIPEGTGTAAIGDVLAEADVITDAGLWNWYTKLNDPGTIQAGSYIMRVNSSFDEAIDDLAKKPLPPNSTMVTIPPGLIQSQLAAYLTDPEDGVPGFTVEGVNAALNDPSVRSPLIPEGQPLLEGTLFPETYAIEEGATELDLIKLMVAQFTQVAEEVELATRAEAVGRTPYEVLIVASMIERESGTAADDPKVARVIYNRLAHDGILGIDATSCYDEGTYPCQQTTAVLEDNTPYDTRKQAGLPPTPIASPGRSAIEAALAPAEGPWMWYVLDGTKDDRSSYFTDDYDDFLAAKARCQEAGLCG